VHGASALDPWKPYLRQRWDAGTTKIAVLYREITALGYAGSEPATCAWLALLKLAALPAPPASRPDATKASSQRPQATLVTQPKIGPRAKMARAIQQNARSVRQGRSASRPRTGARSPDPVCVTL
jgi:hypothetical protein